MSKTQRPETHSRRRRAALVVAVIAGLTISLGAWADWAVNDSEAIGHLKKIRESIGDMGSRKDLLDYQKNQSTVGKGDFPQNPQNGDLQGRYKDPDVTFKSSDLSLTKNAAKLTSITMDDTTRCPQPMKPNTGGANGNAVTPNGGSEGIPDKQYKVCKDILETQKAQFKYNVMMSELADARYQRLKDIEQQRGQIKDLEAGKLQDNTNKMLALIALVQIDQQQQKTYNDAYNARIVYLQGVQERLSQMALHGNGKAGLKEVAGSLGEYATLGAALGVSPGDLISK